MRELWAGVVPVMCNSRKQHVYLTYSWSMLGLYCLNILIDTNGKETMLPFIKSLRNNRVSKKNLKLSRIILNAYRQILLIFVEAN